MSSSPCRWMRSRARQTPRQRRCNVRRGSPERLPPDSPHTRRVDMRYVPLFTTALALALGCRPVETPEQQAARIAQESQAAKQAIDAKDATWARLSAAGHSDSLALNYAAAAVLLPTIMPPVGGGAVIGVFFVLITMFCRPPTIAAC